MVGTLCLGCRSIKETERVRLAIRESVDDGGS